MADIVDRSTRSRMMSGIKGKNTTQEVRLRKALFKMGYRYRINYKRLSGKPDIVFVSRKAVIFVHGCFWHGHDCHLFKWPKTRKSFWRVKITGNQKRDKVVLGQILGQWRCLIVWECALKGKDAKPLDLVAEKCALWINSDIKFDEIRGE